MTDISVPKYNKKYHARDSKIRTQPATDGYRDGWERVFGKKSERASRWEELDEKIREHLAQPMADVLKRKK